MEVINVKQSKSNDNVEYIEPAELEDKKTVYSRAHFIRIDTGSDEKKLSLKIGRYNKTKFAGSYIKADEPEASSPKSELTLNNTELNSLVDYINKNYYPLKESETKYISLDNLNYSELIKDNPKNVTKLIEVALTQNLDLSDVNNLIELSDRKKALKEFEKMYMENAKECLWQKWFQHNNWVLGSDFVRVSDDRNIDEDNIADFIVENLDGFIDVIEIKRPGESSEFFESKKNHDNYVPSSTLTKAITQLANYLLELEKKANNIDTTKRLGKILKPRGILVFGNSKSWNDEQWEAFRLLNGSLSNISVMTYNMIYIRAKNMNDYLSKNFVTNK
jgi:hypothetical protein